MGTLLCSALSAAIDLQKRMGLGKSGREAATVGLDGGVAAPGGKASRDGTAADEGGGAGSGNLKL